MGRLIEGAWHDQWYDTAANAGRFERSRSRFRSNESADIIRMFNSAFDGIATGPAAILRFPAAAASRPRPS